MRAIQVRELREEERAALKAGLKSSSAFTLRRSQILLMSADKQAIPRVIGESLGCSDQCVRDAIRAFEREGTACLREKSHARHDEQAAFTRVDASTRDEVGVVRLKELVKLSPRNFGYETSLWTRELLAQQCYKEKLTSWLVSGDTISNTLKRSGIAWRRAKQWIRSTDPQYAGKKTPGLAQNHCTEP